MRKRACLGRMLLYGAETALLDEPFAALDAQLKLAMHDLMLRLVAENRQTVILVTHDLMEAVTLADRVLVCTRRPATIALEQRIALARALASDPEVVLLDEPFAALDANLRESLRQEVRRILKDAGKSALLVTHDQAEALSLADTVAVMRGGRVLQVGTPEEIYERPRSRWLAEFLGETDVLPGTASGGIVECELGRFNAGREFEGAVDVMLRPESVAIGLETSHARFAHARVVERAFYGHDQLVGLELASGVRVRSRRLGFPAWHPGDHVRVWVDGPVNVLAPEAD